MKAEGWAVVGPNRVVVSFGLIEAEAWARAEALGPEAKEQLIAWGYRCVPVTIEWRE